MSTTNDSPKPLSVAIIGGGIGGLCAALALLKYPNIDVQIYEAAPTFGEIGAGVGLGPNAKQALTLIGPEARAAYDKHITGNMWPKHAKTMANFVVGEGEHEGELIHAQLNSTGQQSVHRAHFLDELVKSIPSHRAHFNKRVDKLDDKQDGPVTIHFKDGTTATADAVIGADGIHSVVRAHLLGEEAAKPVFAGSAVYRALVPMEKAVEKLGEEFAQNAHFLCGHDKATLSYPISHGTLVNVVLFDLTAKTWEHEKMVQPVDPATVRKLYSTWGANPRALVELLLATPSPTLWAMYEHSPAPTYVKGRVAIMGDAAHATTPYQGQGAAQAIEDALVLGTVLGCAANSTSDSLTTPTPDSTLDTLSTLDTNNANTKTPMTKKLIETALLAYDQTRRLRSQRVVSTSRDSGLLVSMQASGVGDDLGKMRALFGYRNNWMWNRDVGAQNGEAVRLFAEGL